MNRFSIRDIENLTGIRAHTIRIWEQRYGILQPKRTATNIRYYDGEDLKAALRIGLLNNYGYKISRIRSMTESDMNTLINKVSDDDFRLKVITNNLLEAALDMDMPHFEQLIDTYIRKHGLELTVENLLFGFLEKAGLMWMTNRMMPAQEHLSTNVIHRKLSGAIETLPMHTIAGKAPVILFLPEGEYHDLGLIYVQYLLRKAGHPVYYLGNNTPLSDVEHVYKTKKIKHLYLHLTCIGNSFEMGDYQKKLSDTFADASIYISGPMLQHKKTKVYGNIKILNGLTESKALLSALQ